MKLKQVNPDELKERVKSMCFTPRALRLLCLADEERVKACCFYVGTDHIKKVLKRMKEI